MHDEIRRFHIDGEISAERFVTARERVIEQLESMMRDEGYTPVLDLPPQFTRSFDPEKEDFSFELSVYGVQVGVERAWASAGIMNGTILPKYTPQPK